MCCSDGSKAAGANYSTAGIMGAEVITAMVLELMRLPCAAHNIRGAPHLLGLPIG
jgi:hypothetical protein